MWPRPRATVPEGLFLPVPSVPGNGWGFSSRACQCDGIGQSDRISSAWASACPPRPAQNLQSAVTRVSGRLREAEPGGEKAESGREKAEPGREREEPGREKAEPGGEKAEPGGEKAEPGREKAEPGGRNGRGRAGC